MIQRAEVPHVIIPQIRLAAIAIIGSLASAGCGTSPAAPAATPDTVSSLTDVAPALGTRLLRGQTVTFTATAGYSLNTADSGRVVLAIEDQNYKLVTSNQMLASVSKGNGQVTLSQTVTLPDTGITALYVFVFFAPAGINGPFTVGTVTQPQNGTNLKGFYVIGAESSSTFTVASLTYQVE